nr:hypothetical protein [Tanacetum cinerariifolium]
MGDENHIRTLGDYFKPSHEGYRNTIELPVENNVDLLQKVPHYGIDLWLQAQIFMIMAIPSQDKPLTNRPVVITLPQGVPSTFDHHLIRLENQVQRLMEDHLAPTQPTQVNKVTTLCDICSGPHGTQYCMEDPKQAFVEYASSRNNNMGN